MKKTQKLNQTDKKFIIALWAAGILCAASLVFLLVSFNMAPRSPFVPPAFDPAAQVGTPEVPQELGWSQIQHPSLEYSAAVCGVFLVEDSKADSYFTNLEGNAWLKLRILDEAGNILGETGLIRPGEYVQSVTLDVLPSSGDTIVMKLMAYEPDTYFSLGSVILQTVATVAED